jgi:hypothetical protein
MASYIQINDPGTGKLVGVLRDDGALVPADTDNRDWRTFLEWNAAQLSPLPLNDLPPETAAQVTADLRSLGQALLSDPAGAQKLQRAVLLALLDQLNTLRAALPAPLPAVTVAQARAAVIAKITSGAAD